MKIAYNPSGASPLAGAPENNNDIIFDLAGKAIYVKDVKLLGTDTVYDVFKKHTSSSGGGNVGLVPVPSYTNTNTRFLREDGTWVVPTNTTYSVFTGSTLENSGKAGLVPAPLAGFKKLLLSDGTWTLKFLSYDIPANSAIKITFYSQTHATLFMRHTWSNNMGVYHISGYGKYGDTKRISIVEVINSCSGIIYPVEEEFAIIIKNPETVTSLFVSMTLLLGSISKIETVTSEVTKSDIWRNVLHSGNAHIKNGIVTINGESITPLTQHQSLSNYVTLDTTLTITGYKNFTKQVKISTAGKPLNLKSSTTNCDINFSITNTDGTTTDSRITLKGDANFVVCDSGWKHEYTILHSNNYTKYKHAYTNLTGSGTTANLAIVSTGIANGWTLKTLGSNAFDSTKYLPLTGGTLTGDLNFSHLSANVKGYITWTGGTVLQRIQISDNSSTNDAVFTFLQSTNSGTDWTNLFTIKDNGSVVATTFLGNLDGTYVNKLTGYSKATAAADLATTDTLNAALGKLEYKADTTYDWYKSITNTDTDDVVNKWGEIVDFIDSIKEGTDILDEFVTRKTDLTITGLKLFNTSSNTLPLLISRSNGESQVLKIGVDDIQATFEYVNDESSNVFLFKLVNTDSEGSDGSNANSSYVKFYGDAAGSTVIANRFMGQLDKTLTFTAGAFTTKTYNNSTAVTVNIPTHTSHLTNNSGFLTQHQSLANYVTLNTDQTITGAKTFKRIIYGNAYNYNENKAGAYLVLTKGGDYLGIGASSSNIQAIVIGESDLSGTWIKEHVTIDTSGHVKAAKFIGTSKSGPWYLGRDYAAFKTTGYSGGYSPTLSIKTTNGSWELGTLNDSNFINNLIFSYVTDTDYNSGTNQNVKIKLPYTKSGTIALTSDITKTAVGLGNVLNTAFYARTATVNGVDYSIAGTKSGATFSIYSPTTVGTYGLVLVSNGSGAPSWVNLSSLSTKWDGSADWTAVTTVNLWSRILTINSSNCNVILLTEWSLSSQASAHLYLISIGYLTAKIIQLGCGEYKNNYAVKIRVTYESGAKFHIEVFNSYGYLGATTISIPCRIINCGNCSFTTIDTYTQGDGTVKAELISHYHIAKNLHSEWSSNGIFYIEGTGTTAGTWLGSHTEILSYYAGLTIAYKIPIAGASTTTLNINGLGAKTCYYNNSNLTTHYPKNTTVILVYDGTNFVVADYNYTRTDVRLYLTDSTNSEYPLLFRYNTEAPTSNGYITEYTRYASAITVNPSTNTITTNIKGNIAPLEKLSYTLYTTSKAVKDRLVDLFSNINTGIGANVIVPAKAIEHWNSETTTLTNSSVYAMIKIGGGYSGTTYGLWLLSSCSNSKIGYVGRSNSTWGDIHWLATTEDIDSLKNYYWANIKISSSANSSTSPTFASATISGVTSTNTLTISNTSDTGHINFSRGSHNYITMPSGGLLHILPNGVGVSSSSGMVFSSNGLHPATNLTYKLGTSSLKWDLVHTSELLSTICKSILIELNLAGGLSNYGGFIDFHFHNSDGKPTDNLGNIVETTPDYTSRIIENAAGTLNINGTTFKNGRVTSTGFIKSGSSDSYILLGGGNHKAVSDFLLKSELGNLELANNLTTITKSLTVTADWMDTGIKSTDLPASGTYIIQVYVAANDSAGYMYNCYWSGLMSWYSRGTNDTESDEILLHRAGHAYDNTIYLRTIMTTNSDGRHLRLQIAANKDLSAAYTYTFKFKRVI